MGTTFGEHLDAALRAGGVTASFGVPGGQTLPLYGAALDHGRTHVVMRDERNAACAADAYARVAGTVGVCDATTGPGITNLVSGLAEAYASSVPVLAVIADIPREHEHLRRRSVASQAAPQQEVLAPVSKWFARVQQAEYLDDMLDHALRVALTGRPGPVVLEVPEDVFLGPGDAGQHKAFSPSDFAFPRHRPAPDRSSVTAAADVLVTAQRPLILAGGGVHLSRAAAELARVAEAHQIPVATTINGKGSLDERGPLSAGVVGMFGSGKANAAIQAADVVVAVGTKLDQLTTHRWRLPRPDGILVHVDVDGEELGRAMPAHTEVVADAREFLTALGGILTERSWSAGNWLLDLDHPPSPGTDRDDPRIAPEHVLTCIDRCLGPGDLLVSDASLASGWAAAHFNVKHAGVGMVAPRGLAGIGWSPGAAIGARHALADDRQVVAVTGDGAWAFGLSEVETAVRLGLDLVYVILNNSALGWIKHVEEQMGLGASSGFGDVDYAAVAAAMGAHGRVVADSGAVEEAVAEALAAGGTHVVDVRTTAVSSPIISYRRTRDGGAYQ